MIQNPKQKNQKDQKIKLLNLAGHRREKQRRFAQSKVFFLLNTATSQAALHKTSPSNRQEANTPPSSPSLAWPHTVGGGIFRGAADSAFQGFKKVETGLLIREGLAIASVPALPGEIDQSAMLGQS